MQGNINSANAGLANTNMQGTQAIVGGTMQGAGSAMSMVGGGGGGARGGMVKKMAEGGETAPFAAPAGNGPVMNEPAAPESDTPGMAGIGPVGGVGPLADAAGAPAPMGPQSMLGQYLAGQTNTSQYMGAADEQGTNQSTQSSIANTPNPVPQGMGYGSQMLWKGAKDSSQAATEAAMAAARGGLASQGGGVTAKSPEQKATKSGNSYSNDKVPALLSEGEVVIPRSVMQSREPARSAADFVAKVLAKRRAS